MNRRGLQPAGGRAASLERHVSVRIRPAIPEDIEECGRIIHTAFTGIASQHGFPSDFPTVADGVDLARQRIPNPTIYSIVAEVHGRIAGSTFMNQRDPIFGIGTVSVDPEIQAQGVGRLMMEDVVRRGRDAAGMRLTQDAFNTASMSLYSLLGFEIREPLVQVEGSLSSAPVSGVEVRPLRPHDIPDCEELCVRVHGIPRTQEIWDALKALSPFVALRDGRVVAYTTALAKRGHGVAACEEDMEALLLGINGIAGGRIAFLLPSRQAGFFRWCLAQGLRVAKPLTLMAQGVYREPQGCFFASTQY
jgi:ribosomal protein S18 acetylase RimI-like enzyme